MASAFGHALAAITMGTSFSKTLKNWKFWTLGIICSILPDADVIGFQFNIAYESFWGHRGFSHSLLFAALVGIVVTVLFFRKDAFSKKGLGLMFYYFLCTASHAVLDALTSGGLGIAFLSPFDDTRYFFPWRPIQVSPIGIEDFLGEWGKRVLLSEAIWIGIPCAAYLILVFIIRKVSSPKT